MIRLGLKQIAYSLVLLVGLAVLAVLLSAKPPRLEPTPSVPTEALPDGSRRARTVITWTPTSVEAVVSPRETATTQVSFVSTKNIRRAEVPVSQELASIVGPVPAVLERVRKGQQRTIQLVVSPSATTALGTYTGTIQIVRRKVEDDDDDDDYDPEEQGKPLSRPLTLIVHVAGVGASILLPPDPGEAGKATLEGIDSDGDGVRDDIQRFIALTYPNSEKTRAALAQYAKAQQQFLLSATEVQLVLEARNRRTRAMDCLNYIRPADSRTIRLAVRAEILNTLLRSKAYNSADAKLSGQTFSITPPTLLKQQCDFDPDAMEN